MLDAIFGSDPQKILWWQMCARATLVFVFALLLFRLSLRRIFGRIALLDIAIALLLGSTLSRALTGNARLFPSLAAVTTLVVLHELVVLVAFRIPAFRRLVKGREHRLVTDGEPDHRAMARAGIAHDDLMEAIREKASMDSLAAVRAAYLERDGSISVIRRQPPGPG